MTVVNPMRKKGPVRAILDLISNKLFYDPRRDDSIDEISKKVRKKMKHGNKKK